MDIGSVIKQYRTKNKISLRAFAETCGISHSYIAMLESGKNSKTGEQIVPTIVMLKKLSKGLHISLSELIDICDDIPISLSDIADVKTTPAEPELSEVDKRLLELFRLVEPERRRHILASFEAQLKAMGLIPEDYK